MKLRTTTFMVSCKKQLTIILLLTFTPITTYSQISICYESNHMQVPDSRTLKVCRYTDAGLGGEAVVWNFSPSAHQEKFTRKHVLAEDSIRIMCIENAIIYTYQQNSDSLLIVREETPLAFINYSSPKLEVPYDFGYGDVSSLPFYGEGKYCGRLFLRKSGIVNMEADGWGMLVLAENDTLRNVLRVYTITTSSIQLSSDSVGSDAVCQQQEITENYKWYAEGVRYPVFEVTTMTLFNELTPYATYQYALSYDNFCSEEPNDETILEGDTLCTEILSYTIRNNQNRIYIDYELASHASIRMIVADIMGILHRSIVQECDAGIGTLTIDCEGLRHGQYILYLDVDGTTYNNKINIQ